MVSQSYSHTNVHFDSRIPLSIKNWVMDLSVLQIEAEITILLTAFTKKTQFKNIFQILISLQHENILKYTTMFIRVLLKNI